MGTRNEKREKRGNEKSISTIQNLKLIMRLPKLSPPVKRPDIIYPHRSVDVIHGRVEDLVSIRMDLLHGANYNDPAAFQNRSYQQIKSSCSCVI
jgi:cyanobactin biosynthesis protein (PatB/AcyB/McaB family)